VRLLHGRRGVDAVFDDPNLVSCAGLVPVMRLAEQVDLAGLVTRRVRPDLSTGSNPGDKAAASTGSVLRPWPVANTRARADSFAGTSTTVSPSATSRWATCRPMPLPPSTAHTRCGYRCPTANMAR
jgi:hypothetical protein